MCSRYELTAKPRELARRFGLVTAPALPNMVEFRPTDQALVIQPAGIGVLMAWGLRPKWSAKPLINARAETLTEKHTFRPLLESRCVVPASAYFEWRKSDDGKKLKNRIAADDDIIGFAGLHDGTAFAIVTCRPAPTIAHIHGRMPVILSAEGESKWLDPTLPFVNVATALAPYDAASLVAIEETPPPPTQRGLFD